MATSLSGRLFSLSAWLTYIVLHHRTFQPGSYSEIFVTVVIKKVSTQDEFYKMKVENCFTGDAVKVRFRIVAGMVAEN